MASQSSVPSENNQQTTILKRGISANGVENPPDSASSSPLAKRPCFLQPNNSESVIPEDSLIELSIDMNDLQELQDLNSSGDNSNVVAQLQNLTTRDTEVTEGASGQDPATLLPYHGKATVKGNQTNIEHIVSRVAALETGPYINPQAVSDLVVLQQAMSQMNDKMKTGLDQLSQLIEDSTTGLKPRVQRLENEAVPKIQAVEASYKKFNKETTERLDDLELKFDRPDSGVIPRLKMVENKVKGFTPGKSTRGSQNAEITALKDEITKLKAQVMKTQGSTPPSDWQTQLANLQTEIITLKAQAASSEHQLATDHTYTPQPWMKEITSLRVELNKLRKDVSSHGQQLEMLVAWADTLYRSQENLHNMIVFNSSKILQDYIIIGGIKQVRQENCVSEAAKFLRKRVRIQFKDTEIITAFRLPGQPRGKVGDHMINFPRLMSVKCTPALKKKIMANAKNLAGQMDPQSKFKFFVSSQQPEEYKAARARHQPKMQQVKARNAKKPAHQQQKIQLRGKELFIDNERQIYPIHPPSPMEMREAFKKEKGKLDALQMFTTHPITLHGSTFVGMAVEVSRLDDVRLAYVKARDLQPYADHVMAGYIAAGNPGSCDHGEHFGGLEILKTIKQASRTDIAVFVSRIYGGVHLGSKRFRIIRNLVKELFQIIDLGARSDAVDDQWRTALDPQPTGQAATASQDDDYDDWNTQGPRESWSDDETQRKTGATQSHSDEEAMDT